MKAKKKIIKYLESLGFETTFHSKAFSNHVHPIDAIRVDIMYVEGTTADQIFGSTEDRLIFKDIELPVVSAEHLIAMKLFAVQNNPDRKYKDLGDIKEILKHTECNKKIIKEYFEKYGQGSLYKEFLGEIDEE